MEGIDVLTGEERGEGYLGCSVQFNAASCLKSLDGEITEADGALTDVIKLSESKK